MHDFFFTRVARNVIVVISRAGLAEYCEILIKAGKNIQRYFLLLANHNFWNLDRRIFKMFTSLSHFICDVKSGALVSRVPIKLFHTCDKPVSAGKTLSGSVPPLIIYGE
jgi:hypothetical protein